MNKNGTASFREASTKKVTGKALKTFSFIAFGCCVTMLCFYFKQFHGHWSSKPADWGTFGGYFGSITGLLAFGGVLITAFLAEKRAKETEVKSEERYINDSERNTFFQLLDLHRSKFENVVDYNNDCKGAEAFKQYTQKANRYFNLYVIYEDIIASGMDAFRDKGEREIIDLMKEAIKILDEKSNHITTEDDLIERLRFYLETDKTIPSIHIPEESELNGVYIDWCGELYSKMSPREIVEKMREVFDIIYKEDGHILGHYFRNMYYMMDIMSHFSSSKINYKHLFRAQISRYEIALGLFNAVSSKSGSNMIHYLMDFNIFKDIYPTDITCLNAFAFNNKGERVDEYVEKLLFAL